ncbi:hypothetical protein G3T14_11260 [Methylobacterium sp. BTF04]|uniref:hypothetical protein n=1 Tax=Methylobacterium sp. BTF04 TaxID=2708300 RepID=UPI0013CF928A|nr:hypothetical protein [Methylobacterium sp. BTF04]NEU12713.1 hypothetical protein [Methylobacterium sp. BTF04]
MSRILLVAQDTSAIGKSTVTRALAECVPDAPVYEVESSRHLVELGDRVRHFAIRTERKRLDETGGEAAIAEYDPVLNRLLTEPVPAIVDIGANGGVAFLEALAQMAAAFDRRKKTLGVLVVVAHKDDAYATGRAITAVTKGWAAARFLMVNHLHGEPDAAQVKELTKGATAVTTLAKYSFPTKALPLIAPLGLALIPQLDEDALAKHLAKDGAEPDVAMAIRTRASLDAFRLAAMKAVEPAARWLIDADKA